jgi:hypothetical protein
MQRHRALSALTCCAIGAASNAQSLMRSVPGPAAGAQFGRACIVVPDQDSDGFKDLLVGAPGFNSGRGAIYCISGRFLATGAGVSTIWSLTPAANPGDNFGFALADVGDVTGDGVHDFLVGQPGYDAPSASDVGAVRLVHGSARVIVSLLHGTDSCCEQFGFSIAACGDLNLNGFPDVAVGAPDYSVSVGLVRVFDGFALTQSGSVQGLSLAAFGGQFYVDQVGWSVASGADFTGDGIAEIVAGSPGRDHGSSLEAGRVIVYDIVEDEQYFVDSLIGGERLGAAVSVGHDYDGDGVPDIVAGAPHSPNGSSHEVGRVVVYSGARVVAQTMPQEIYAFALTAPSGFVLPPPDFHFGEAVAAVDDLNNDGVGEILVGAPDFFTNSGANAAYRGLVRIFSGATGAQFANITGASTDRLGDGIGAVLDDLDGDGFHEFALGGSLADVGGADSGVLKCFRLFPVQPATYCAGKINSLGCTPAMGVSGLPSASSGLPCSITSVNVINQKNGLLFYGRSAAAVLFQGGVKCVANPISRTPAQNSGGSAGGADCTGVFSFDFNGLVSSGVDPSLTAGAEIYAQYWSRDPQSAIPTSLSNALRVVINP